MALMIVVLLALATAGLVSIPAVVSRMGKQGKNAEAGQFENACKEELKKKGNKKLSTANDRRRHNAGALFCRMGGMPAHFSSGF